MKHDGHGAKSALSTTRVVVLGFAFVILMGALLLTLPISSANGVSVGFFDALFTSCLLYTSMGERPNKVLFISQRHACQYVRLSRKSARYF